MKKIFNGENLDENTVYFGWKRKNKIYGGIVHVDWDDEEELFNKLSQVIPISIIECMKEDKEELR